MTEHASKDSSADDAIDSILADYCRQVDAGTAPDRAALLAKHPEAAAALVSYFQTCDVVERMAGGIVADFNAPGNAFADEGTLLLPSADIAPPPPDPARDSTLRNQQATVIKEQSLTGLETLPPIDQVPIDRDAIAKEPKPAASVPQQIGRYRIEKILGQGAMGTVYLAHDTGLGRRVALKIPKFAATDGHEFIERFYREARTAANLRNSNICPVYDVGELDGAPFITMAFIEGKTLSEYIRPQCPQPERQIAGVVRKLANALAEAHAHGIVHRDLKPANIMIDTKGEPIIMDFGLAREMSGDPDSTRLTHLGMMIGTPAYMPPEQVNGENDRVGPHSDVYALGVILYELLTGQIPFQGPLAAVLGQILTVEPSPPSRVRPDLDPRLEAICLRMMAKRIEDRPESMSVVAAMITEFLRTPRPAAEPALTATTIPKPESARPKDRLRDTPKVELDAVGRTARRLFAKHDYEQTVQLLEQIPDATRSEKLTELLQQAMERNDEVNFLIARLQDGLSRNHLVGLVPIVSRLLELKPGNRLAIEAHERIEQSSSRRSHGLWNLIGLGALPPIARTAVAGMFLTFFCAAIVIIIKQGDIETTVEIPDDAAGTVKVNLTMTGATDGAEDAAKKGLQPRQVDIRIGADGSKKVPDQQLKARDAAQPAKAPPKVEVAIAPTGSAVPGAGVRGSGDLLWKLQGHTKAIRDIAISPDSRSIVSVGWDESVRIWDVQNGKQVHQIKGDFTSAVFTPGSRSLILGHAFENPNKYLQKFTVGNWGEVQSFSDAGGMVDDIAISADGKRLVSTNHGGVHIWDVETRVRIARFDKPKVKISPVAFDPQAKFVFGSVGKNQIGRWQLPNGEMTLLKRTGSDYCILSPDGRFVANTDWSGGHDLQNFQTGELITHVHTPHAKGGSPRAVAISPNGEFLLSGADDHLINLVQISKQTTIKGFKGHEEAVHHVLFSPDGSFAVSACDNVYNGTLKQNQDGKDTSVRVWSLPPEVALSTGTSAVSKAITTPKWTPKSFGPIFKIEQPKGDIARTNFRWKLGGDEKTFGTRATWLRFSPNSRYVASIWGSRPPQLIDTKTGKILREIPVVAPGTVLFTPDSRSAVLLQQSGERIAVMDLETGQVLPTDIRISPKFVDGEFLNDGSLILLSSDSNGGCQILEWPSGKVKAAIEMPGTAPAYRQAYNSDVSFFATGVGRTANVAVWDRANGKEAANFRAHVHPHWLTCITFSHDGKYFATASHDGLVKFWKPGTNQTLFDLPHGDWIEDLSFSPDDRYLAVSSHTMGYRVWDVSKRKVVSTIPAMELTGAGVTISPDGKLIAIASYRHNADNSPRPKNPDGFAEMQLWELQYELPKP